ncbi:MAG TPA: PIG-L family deacetylase [Vicinamibacterales bacterium]|nr:PIG-L family deacetylase [Vicinamibacterales bacterium]
MRFNRFVFAAAALALATSALTMATRAQQRSPQFFVEPLSDANGQVGLGLALRKLTTVGTFMHTTAHPDDENNAVLALHARGLGMRVALLTATRGDGGQNEIGPELFDAIGVLRTEELLAAHRWDGAEQYFTRAVDFGFSFSPQETIQKWGHDEILGDFVRMIRTIRPDVMVTLPPTGTGGGQHHQVSSTLSFEAFTAAADPSKFPEQLQQGLRTWQVKKLYQPGGGGFGRLGGPGGPGGRGGRGGRGGPPPPAGAGRAAAGQPSAGAAAGGDLPPPPPPDPNAKYATIDTSGYDPLLGCTIGEVGGVAASMHKCQGRSPIQNFGGVSGARYRLAATVIEAQKNKDETSLFEGIDTSLASLLQYAGATPPAALRDGLAAVTTRAINAQKAFMGSQNPAVTLPDLLAGLTAVRTLRSALPSYGLTDSALYEIDLRLKQKEDQFQQAIILAHGLRMDAIADDGVVMGNQPIRVTTNVANRGPEDVAVKSVKLLGFNGDAACPSAPIKNSPAFNCSSDVKIPAAAKLTNPYWIRLPESGRAELEPDAPQGLPFRPSPFRARFEFEITGVLVSSELPVQYRYAGDLATGEKRMELNVVPGLALHVEPAVMIVPLKVAAGVDRRKEVRVTVENNTKGAATASIGLKVPAGWRVLPASQPVSLSAEGESTTVRFTVSPPAAPAIGELALKAEATAAKAPDLTGSEQFTQGYQVIEYPHIQRRQKVIPAETTVKVVDVGVAPGIKLGYVMGVGDLVPQALDQLGVKATMIDSEELAYGNLAKYDTIMLGIRAYERREDLKAYNHRLIKYVNDGGTLIVQYNKTGEFNQAQYGPYPALVSSNRVTDETAPVEILEKEHHAFTYPNRIRQDAWDGWVQERGLYFLGEKDAKYTDLVQLQDPFEYNPGAKGGALVEARLGKGRWIYVGLGLWRQLPYGTVGAYQLMANLISLGKVPKAAPITR